MPCRIFPHMVIYIRGAAWSEEPFVLFVEMSTRQGSYTCMSLVVQPLTSFQDLGMVNLPIDIFIFFVWLEG